MLYIHQNDTFTVVATSKHKTSHYYVFQCDKDECNTVEKQQYAIYNNNIVWKEKLLKNVFQCLLKITSIRINILLTFPNNILLY